MLIGFGSQDFTDIGLAKLEQVVNWKTSVTYTLRRSNSTHK